MCGALLATAAIAHPALAQNAQTIAIARDGFRVEARATYETPTVSSVAEDDDVFKLGSAFAFGGEAGFDIALGDRFVVGPYGQYEVSSVESCEGTFCLRAKDWLEAGLHVGYATGPNGQVYGKIGYGRLTLETEGTDPEFGDLDLSSQQDGSGVAFSIGYEQGFGEMFYGRIEGGYADVGDIYTLNFQRSHAGVSLGARF